jgi:hypothetical protein
MNKLTCEDRMIDYKKLSQIEKNNKDYEILKDKAIKIVMKHYNHLKFITVDISLDYMVDFHGIDALKGIIGVENWTNENIEDYPDTAMSCIGHDLPSPNDLRHDILPKCMGYTQYC